MQKTTTARDNIITATETAIDARMKADDSTRSEAATAVYRENPELRAAYVEAFNKRRDMGQ